MGLCWAPQGGWRGALSGVKGMTLLFCYPGTGTGGCTEDMAKGLNRGGRDRQRGEKADLPGWTWDNNPEDMAHTPGPLEHDAGR